MLKVAVINDTYGPHAGCQLVKEAICEQLDRVGVELLGTVHKSVLRIDLYPDFVKRADLIIVNGEGSIHHGNRSELLEVATRFPAILINCVFEANPPTEALQAFRFISARESLSAAEISAQGANVELIPDVIITSSTLCGFRRAPPVADIGITDNVTDADSGFSVLVGAGNVHAYLNRLASYRRLCAGRFHAALIAAVLGIPFSAWASNTHKTKGLMSDMGIPHCYGETQMEALVRVPAVMSDSVSQFIQDGRKKVESIFNRLDDFV